MLCKNCEFENDCKVRQNYKKMYGKELTDGGNNRCSGILKRTLEPKPKIITKREKELDDLLNIKEEEIETPVKIIKKRPLISSREGIRIYASINYKDYEKLVEIAEKEGTDVSTLIKCFVKLTIKDPSIIKEPLEWLI